MTIKSSISLTDEQHVFAKALVDAGRFPSVSAVLQQGIQLLQTKMQDEAAERSALVEILSQRRKAKFISAAKMDVRLARMLSRKRKTHAVHD